MSDNFVPNNNSNSEQRVQIRFQGYTDTTANLVGYTIAEVRQAKATWGIPSTAVAYRGGTPVAEDHILSRGDLIEFIRPTGEKG